MLAYAFLFFRSLLRSRYRALIVALSLCIPPSLLQAEENRRSEIPGKESGWLLTLGGGYAWQAQGSIVQSSSEGLALVQGGINTGILYSPGVSEAYSHSPVGYTIPAFRLSSRSFQISLSHPSGLWEPGFSLGYVDIIGRAKIPATFVDLGYFNPGIQGLRYYPVTSGGSHFLFATDLFVEGFLYRHLSMGDGWDAFAGGGVGAGRGWLAGFGEGPYLEEAHGSAVLGAGYRFQGIFTFVRAAETYYGIRSAPTSLIDRREVLVNPRTGNIRIGRVEIGLSFPVF